MPHQCVRCGAIYDDADDVILKGCPKCGGKFFFYIPKEKLEKAKEVHKKLSDEEKKQIEDDIKDILNIEIEQDMPVVLDFEAISIDEPGKYKIDLVKLMKQDAIIFKIEDGKYVIDIATTMKNFLDQKGEKN